MTFQIPVIIIFLSVLPPHKCREELLALKVSKFFCKQNREWAEVIFLASAYINAIIFHFNCQGIGQKRAEYILELREETPRPLKTVSLYNPSIFGNICIITASRNPNLSPLLN